MAQITYIEPDGRISEVEVSSGKSVMQGAMENMIDSILAECGGACSCGTCHVYVDEAWVDKLEEPDTMEKAMLECVLEPEENSRLSCQITVTDELDGLVVRTPKSQY